MGYNPDKHHRRSIRLRNWNYTNAGSYFVTICLNQRIFRNTLGNGKHTRRGKLDTPRSRGAHAGAPLRGDANMNCNFPILGTIANYIMILNDYGKMVEKYILEIINNTNKFSGIKINEYIIMPDHVHAIIEINNATIGLGTVIQWFKTMTTNEYANNVKTLNWQRFNKRLWQRNYYEYIIRNEAIHAKITQYIHNNPILWQKKHSDTIL